MAYATVDNINDTGKLTKQEEFEKRYVCNLLLQFIINVSSTTRLPNFIHLIPS